MLTLLIYMFRIFSFFLFLLIWCTIALTIWIFIVLRFGISFSTSLVIAALTSSAISQARQNDLEARLRASFDYWPAGLRRSILILSPSQAETEDKLPFQISHLDALRETILLIFFIIMIYLLSIASDLAGERMKFYHLSRADDTNGQSDKSLSEILGIEEENWETFAISERPEKDYIFEPASYQFSNLNLILDVVSNGETESKAYSASNVCDGKLPRFQADILNEKLNDLRLYVAQENEDDPLLMGYVFLCSSDDDCIVAMDVYRKLVRPMCISEQG